MRKYWQIFRSTWQDYITYRANFYFEIFGATLLMLVTIALWYSIFETGNYQKIGQYTLPEMITYLIGAGLISSFLWFSAQGEEISDDIHWGRFSTYLVKPIKIPFYYFVRDICRRLVTLMIGLIGYIIIIIFLKSFIVPAPNFWLYPLSLIFIIFAGILHYSIFYLVSIFAFWLEQNWGLQFIIRVILEITTGVIIPITLFPANLYQVLNVLPFKYLIFIPMQIYLGKLSFNQIGYELTWVIGWIILFNFLSLLVWKKGLKHYTAVGQ